MKYSKYLGLFAILALTNMLFFSTVTQATPPRFIGFRYDKNKEELNVLISHITPVRSIHYIYRIVIQKNGDIVQVYFYSKQPGFIFNRYKFDLSAEPGDEITVSAFCILYGYNSKSMIIT